MRLRRPTRLTPRFTAALTPTKADHSTGRALKPSTRLMKAKTMIWPAMEIQRTMVMVSRLSPRRSTAGRSAPSPSAGPAAMIDDGKAALAMAPCPLLPLARPGPDDTCAERRTRLIVYAEDEPGAIRPASWPQNTVRAVRWMSMSV